MRAFVRNPLQVLPRAAYEEDFVAFGGPKLPRAWVTSPELVKRFLDDVPMKRFGEAEEIGELVLFMCSDACSFMTGDTVMVNGGGGWR